MTRKVQWHVN